MIKWSLSFLGILLAFTVMVQADELTEQVKPLPYARDYFKLRDGLQNCRIKFERGKKARVVFLGGSITQMGGWCRGVETYLKTRFPGTVFDFTNAGIPSMGSTPHSFRFLRDVLKNGPVDLLFIEAAVNDDTNGMTSLEMLRGMEGVVRQARLSNPDTDIIMLHFIYDPLMKLLNEGRVPTVIDRHEAVADYYGVPSMNLAKEMTERIRVGQFRWAEDFKGTHPSPFGHDLYARAVARLFDEAWKNPLLSNAVLKACRLPEKPLDEKSYFRGKLVPLNAATTLEGWAFVPDWKPSDPPEKKIGTYTGFVNVPSLVAEKPGSTLRLKFEGTGVGIFVAAGPDAGMLEYSVDGSEFIERDLFTGWSPSIHLPWAYVLNADLEPGQHELVLRVSNKSNAKSKGTAARIMHFLVN